MTTKGSKPWPEKGEDSTGTLGTKDTKVETTKTEVIKTHTEEAKTEGVKTEVARTEVISPVKTRNQRAETLGLEGSDFVFKLIKIN